MQYMIYMCSTQFRHTVYTFSAQFTPSLHLTNLVCSLHIQESDVTSSTVYMFANLVCNLHVQYTLCTSSTQLTCLIRTLHIQYTAYMCSTWLTCLVHPLHVQCMVYKSSTVFAQRVCGSHVQYGFHVQYRVSPSMCLVHNLHVQYTVYTSTHQVHSQHVSHTVHTPSTQFTRLVPERLGRCFPALFVFLCSSGICRKTELRARWVCIMYYILLSRGIRTLCNGCSLLWVSKPLEHVLCMC